MASQPPSSGFLPQALAAEPTSHASADPHFGHSNGSPRGSVTQTDVDNIIRKKRKQREYKACYPCRSRKVKCDQQVPCKSCLDRHHPEFCTYLPPSEDNLPIKRVDNGATHASGEFEPAPSSAYPFDPPDVPSPHGTRNDSSTFSGETVTLAREDLDRLVNQVQRLANALTEVQNAMKQVTGSSSTHLTPRHGISYPVADTPRTVHRTPMDAESRHYSTEGIHARNELGEVIHIGANSVPALVMALGRGQTDGPDIQGLLGKSMLPIFGLDNESATYPFVSLWGMPASTLIRIQDLAQAIPDESECNLFFHFYRDTAHVVYPAIADINAFQDDLLHFMIARAEASAPNDASAGITERSLYGKSLFWIGLLFAILASGCQCSDLPRKQRELTSQVFVCCSFECLRLTNFFGHSTNETIQTLLVLGNVISNNMNAGVAWALLGLTIRLAQGLGLHKDCPKSTPIETKINRSRIWWAVIWQDSLLSITYDRASSTTSLDRPSFIPPDQSPPETGGWSYHECMYRLCRVGLDIVRERAMPDDADTVMQRIGEQKRELQEIVANSADHLRDSRCCRTLKDQLQHWGLYLHMSYVMSELCRPAICPDTPTTELSRVHRITCIDSLVNTVEAFLGLQNITAFASRSWAAMHRALSSALLLYILQEPRRNPRTRELLQKFVTCLVELTADIDPTELSAPIRRSLTALMKLNNAVPLSTPACSAPYPAAELSPGTGVSGISTADFDMKGWSGMIDSPGLLGMSPLLGFSSEDSPYAVMDQIIWGQKQSPSNQGA